MSKFLFSQLFLPILTKSREFFKSDSAYHLLLGMLGAAILLLGLHIVSPEKPRIATVNITGIVDQFVQSQIKAHLPPSQLKQNVSDFGKQLNITLNVMAKKYHVVLMPSEAVIAGASDLTTQVEKNLSQYESAYAQKGNGA